VEADFVAGFDGFQADADGQMGFANAGGTDEDDVVAVVDKAEVEQAVDLGNCSCVALPPASMQSSRLLIVVWNR